MTASNIAAKAAKLLLPCALSGMAILAVLPQGVHPAAGPSSPSQNGKLRAPLFKKSADGQDTLEVFCIYVQFKDETPLADNSSTTGLGTFGSAGEGPADSDKKQEYALDPNGELRRYRFYLEKHFDFARNYFEKVSQGRVTVTSRIFPPPNSEGKVEPIQLPRTMRQYNPSELDKGSKQKISDFNQERAMRLMSFVWEAVDKADAKEGAENPFRVAHAESLASPGSRKHRCYLLFHAGHSRLLDGGQLGSFGADSPNDFTDFFVTKPDFTYLDSATKDGRLKGEPDPEKRADSLGIKLSTGDTLTEIMMLSESASQDKLNWGINGILVNQLARKMGMPDMFDVVQGISQLGYFDMMDFAGANSENGRGFLPVYPSAWVRYFMGWEEPVTARPTTGTPGGSGAWNDYRIASPTTGPGAGRSTTVKVPLNDREYLLVENRQRADANEKIKIWFSDRNGKGDFAFSKPDSVEIPFAFADSLFLDSLCDSRGKNCKENKLRPRGVITASSAYDLSLPASGMLVWHVNEWFIEQFLRYGAVNAYLGDTLRSQLKGVELVEADGSLTIGKRFKNQLGQDAFDYGSGSDMFPHVRRRRVNVPKDTNWRAGTDTLNVIGSYGHANTNSWNDGRTHLRLEAPVPAGALLEKGFSDFLGDSVFTVRDSVLTLRVHWPANQAVKQGAGWEWPAKADTATLSQSLALLANPAGGTKVVVSLSDSGRTQPFTTAGRRAIAASDTLRPNAAGYDSVFTLLPGGKSRDSEPVPVASLAGKLGRPIGSAVWRDTVLTVLTRERIAFLTLRSDSLAAGSGSSSARSIVQEIAGVAGPVAAGNRLWILIKDRAAVSFGEDGSPTGAISLPEGTWQSLALLPTSGPTASLVAAGAGGKAALIDAARGEALELSLPWGDVKPDAAESFTVATSDFDRDGDVDAFLLGSRGSALLVDLKDAPAAKAFTGYPQRFARSIRFADTTLRYISDDPTPPALADLDQDGHPDILFSGSNSVHAVDWRGAYLKGWPYLLEERQAVGFTYGSALFPETAIRSTPLVAALDGKPLVLVGSPDGLIYAVDAQGKPLPGSKPSADEVRHSGILSTVSGDWPLSMGGISLDTARNPYIHLALADMEGDSDLELLAQSGTGSLNAWALAKVRTARGLGWLVPGGDPGRTSHLDVSSWPAAPGAGNTENIQEFYLFPSPLRGPTATVHLRLGKAAKKARIRVYDLAGNVVKTQDWTGLRDGLQAYNQVLDLKHLGPDVYSALVEVWFDGGRKQKWERFGVIR